MSVARQLAQSCASCAEAARERDEAQDEIERLRSALSQAQRADE